MLSLLSPPNSLVSIVEILSAGDGEMLRQKVDKDAVLKNSVFLAIVAGRGGFDEDGIVNASKVVNRTISIPKTPKETNSACNILLIMRRNSTTGRS